MSCLLFTAGAVARGAEGSAPSTRGKELRVFLVTLSGGEQVYERFGHNMIWVHDPVRGTDKAYNYGMFDWEQENFFTNFLHGRMEYWMEPFDAATVLEVYGNEGRTIWLQELDLTSDQRRELRDFLEWNAREANKWYRYDYYKDNCSTRVRDAIDRVLGGQMKRQMEAVPTGTTYRWHTQRLTPDSPWWFTFFTYSLGQPVDVPLSAWEEGFLPMKLMERIEAVTVIGEDGEPRPLVKSTRVLPEDGRNTEPDAKPNRVPHYLVAGVVWGGLMAGLALLLRPGTGGPRPLGRRLARWGLFVLVLGWAALSGGLGGLITYGWTLTDHTACYWNENLLQMSPLAVPMIVMAPALVLGRRWGRSARWLAAAAVVLSLLGLALKLHPAFWQANAEIIALALPVNLGLAFALFYLARHAAAGRPELVAVATAADTTLGPNSRATRKGSKK